jgi:hypothetical protein
MNRIGRLQPLYLGALSYVMSIYQDLHRIVIGGEGGIRTLDTLLTYTPLAGERLQPLGHFTINFYTGIYTIIDKRSQVARCCEAFASCLYEITLRAPKIEILSATRSLHRITWIF